MTKISAAVELVPAWVRNAVFLLVMWACFTYGGEYIRYRVNGTEHERAPAANLARNPDGTVNVNGVLLNRFMDAYERQVSFQERQTQIQETIAKALDSQTKQHQIMIDLLGALSVNRRNGG